MASLVLPAKESQSDHLGTHIWMPECIDLGIYPSRCLSSSVYGHKSVSMSEICSIFRIKSLSPLYSFALIFARSLLMLQLYFLQRYGKFWLSNNFVCCYESAITLPPACNEHRQVPAQFASNTHTKRSYTSKPIICLFNCIGFARLSFLPIKYIKKVIL